MLSKKKLFNDTFNAVMAVLIILPAFVVIQKMLLREEAPWMGVLFLTPTLLCYPAGRLLRNVDKKNYQTTLFGGAVLGMVLTIPMLVRFGGGQMFLTVIMLFLTAFACAVTAFLMPFIYGPAVFNGKFFITGLGLYVVALALGGEHAASYAAVLNTCAIVLLVVTLFVFNIKGLAEATSPGQKRVRFPNGMRRNNMIILAMFVVLAFSLANIKAIKDAAIAGVMWIGDRLIDFLLGIADLNGVPDGPAGEISYSDGNLSALITEVKFESPFVAMLWQIFLYVLIGAIIILLCFFLYKIVRRLLGRFGGLLDKFSKLEPTEDIFIDETEDIEDEEKGPDDSKTRRRGIRLRAKFDDMPTPRAKVRFAMREFLRKEEYTSRASTPRELIPEFERKAPKFGREFGELYARTRYADEAVSEEDAELARRFTERL